MAEEISNDDDGSSGPRGLAQGINLTPDAHGEAALLLVESLLHALIERTVVTVSEAVEIVETAVEVTLEASEEIRHSGARRTTISLLEAIGTSLRHDL